MTTPVLASEYLAVKGSMWSSKSMLQIIRSKAQATTATTATSALSTTDSDYPSTSNSSPKGESALMLALQTCSAISPDTKKAG